MPDTRIYELVVSGGPLGLGEGVALRYGPGTVVGEDGTPLARISGRVVRSEPDYPSDTIALDVSGSPIDNGEAIDVSFSPGDVVSSEGGVLKAFTNESVTNLVP